jgi:hypothetical protein
VVGVDRLFQHPAIEVKPGQFPVDEPLGALSYVWLRGFNRIFAFVYRCFDRVHDLTCEDLGRLSPRSSAKHMTNQ